jgi:hypothetical protein
MEKTNKHRSSFSMLPRSQIQTLIVMLLVLWLRDCMMGNAMWHAIVITSDRPFSKLHRNGRRIGHLL